MSPDSVHNSNGMMNMFVCDNVPTQSWCVDDVCYLGSMLLVMNLRLLLVTLRLESK